MKLLKKWKHRDNGGAGSNALARQKSRGDFGLTRFRDEIDRTFDRVWRDFDRDPWSALSRLPETFGSGIGAWPAIDMAEDERAVTLTVDVPGLDPKDVDMEISGDVLTIRGQRNDEWEDKAHGAWRRERRSGSFARTITLPSYVDAEKVEARYDKGILSVTIPKVPGKGPRHVQVRA